MANMGEILEIRQKIIDLDELTVKMLQSKYSDEVLTSLQRKHHVMNLEDLVKKMKTNLSKTIKKMLVETFSGGEPIKVENLQKEHTFASIDDFERMSMHPDSF